ncbi:PepSY domain-containing protein [Amorphus sp. MBR-141]
MPRLKVRNFVLAISVLAILGSAAASQETPAPRADLPPQGSVKLSQLVAATEGREGFYAIKSILYSKGEYEVVYYMSDGAEVRLNFDAKTGEVRPPKSGGLFGG